MHAADLWTGVPERAEHLCSADFLDVERYPVITFTSARVDESGRPTTPSLAI